MSIRSFQEKMPQAKQDKPQAQKAQPEYRPSRWAYLQKGHVIKRAVRIRGDKIGKQSCTFCGIGQVDMVVGAYCSFCKARVVKVGSDV